MQQERRLCDYRAYRTHWVCPELSEAKRKRQAERLSRPSPMSAHPVTGKGRQKSKSRLATKKEAESAPREFIRYVEGGGDPRPARITLAARPKRWIEYQRARGIRSRTLEIYKDYIRREIVPIIDASRSSS